MGEHNLLLTASYLSLFTLWSLSYFVIIPVSFSLVVMSTLIVYIGCHLSLRLLESESTGGTQSSKKEVLSAADAYRFPFIGSAALFSLYIAFKYFDKDTINLLLSLYFSAAGTFTLTATLAPFVTEFISSKSKFGFKKTFPLIGEIDALFTPAELVSLFFATIFSVVYFKTKHFMMNNVLGISFCVQSISHISIGSFKVGAVLLVGLFFYDIFWVFGTDVMVTVAKSFDGPIKILFPKVLPSLASPKGEYFLLGLGDIVIPGLFVALLLRFDAMRANASGKNIEHQSFAKPYFHANILCYAGGLILTVIIMFGFKAAQPALLYLVPACLGGSVLTAFFRGEFSHLFKYDEEANDKAAAEKKDVTSEDAKKVD